MFNPIRGWAVGVVRSPEFTVYGTAHPVRTGTRRRVACEFSPAGTKENSPGLQPANPRHAYIGFRQGQEKTGFAPRANRVPKGRKRIAPGFNPGIHVAPRLSPGGTTESALGPRCIWDHIRSRAVWETSTISLYAFCDDGTQSDRLVKMVRGLIPYPSDGIFDSAVPTGLGVFRVAWTPG